MSDPALEVVLDSPARHRLKRLAPVVPLVIWVVLALAFLVSYRANSPPLPLLLGLLCSGISLVGLSLPLVWLSLRQMWGWFRSQRAMRRAIAAIRARDPDRADAELRPITTDTAIIPLNRALAIHTLGVAALTAGDVPRAAALMAHAEATGWLDVLSLRPQRWALSQARATAAILLGDLDEADRHLGLAASGAWLGPHRAFVAYARLLYALRAERWDEALAVAAALDLRPLPPDAQRMVRVLVGFAQSRSGAAVDEAALGSEPWVVPRWTEAHWPELLAFASDRGLVAQSSEGAHPVAR